MAKKKGGIDVDPKQVDALLQLAILINHIREVLALPAWVHRKPAFSGTRTPWELVAEEVQSFETEDRRFFRPALRAIANYRGISRRTSEARFDAVMSPLISDQTMRTSIIAALDMTMETMLHYWNLPQDILFDQKRTSAERRIKTIRMVRHAMLEVSRACGSHLLEAGARTSFLAQCLRAKLYAKHSPQPTDVKPDVLAAVRNAMKTSRKRELIVKTSGKRHTDAYAAIRYLEQIGEFREDNDGNVPGTVP